MEPFFLSCSILVIYCSYLAFADMQRNRQKATAQVASRRSALQMTHGRAMRGREWR